ncbi:MAG: Fe-S cluster assembly protein SufD [Leptolyngbyaceae bacterium]|nr:Fe-S cluster assembly protein SufD [Leptolyngbyaceae bacterium]
MSIQVSTVPETAAGALKASSDHRYTYLATLLSQRPALETPAFKPDVAALLQELRDRATAQAHELAIPSTREEEWRFTDLSPLLQTSFQATTACVSFPDVVDWMLPEAARSRVVFVSGIYAPHVSAIANLPPGAIVGNLASLSLSEPQLARIRACLGQQPGAEEVFTALNTASLTDVAVVWIPKNQVLEVPIHLVFLSDAQETATISQPRCLVILESGSSVTLVEKYAALTPNAGVYFSNAVTEIWLEENAQLNHTRVQEDGSNAFHIGKTAIAQARSSRYTCNAISLGAKLSRHNLEVLQTGEQTETTLNGLTRIRDDQVSDTHSAIAYTKPYGKSRQLHKCIIDDQARAVFNGKVSVPKPAQLTDAGQLNRNILLSPKARVDTKPQLEITADNVKCSHGATVSQLDAEEVFYLQSRGLDQASAQKLLIDAFALEIINQIPVPSLQNKLADHVEIQKL